MPRITSKRPSAKERPSKQKTVPLPTQQEVLEFIKNSSGSVGKREIARAFGLRGVDKIALKSILKELQSQGLWTRRESRFKQNKSDSHNLNLTLPDVITVVISGSDRDGELLARPVEWSQSSPPPQIMMVPWRKGQVALGIGDRVLVRLRRQSRYYSAEPIKVIEASAGRILGVFESMPDGSGRIHPTSRKEKADYLVTLGEKSNAETGDLVIASPLSGRLYGLRRAKIEDIVGQVDSPRAATTIALYGNEIPDIFPEDALAQAESAVAVPAEERTNLLSLPLVTIDGADARDFDDAVWAMLDDDPDNPQGWRCMVAIADVAWYVQPRDALDKEAYRRGNSTYFPDQVVPMLPEALSNGWCSLVPHEERGCLAVEFVLNRDGQKLRHRFCRGLMRSAARLTYEQVQDAHDGNPNDLTAPLLETIIEPLYGAWTVLHKARERRGVLELDLPERQIKLREDGTVEQITSRPHLDSHRLIEDFMIQANVCAAEELEQRDQPVMYRLHAEPNGEKLEALREFLHSLDIKLAIGQSLTPKHFNKILEKAKGTPHQILVNEVILRSQSQAVYGAENIGHFGLGLARYAHFTSPIRRYADLLVHRALIRGLNLGAGGLPLDAKTYFADWGDHISMTERRSAVAEREAVDRYVTAHLASQVGAEFSAEISGVTRFGLFIALEETGANGLIPIRSLPDDYYIHEEKTHSLVGKSSRRSFQLGQKIKVELIEANGLTGSMMFHLAGEGLVSKKQQDGDSGRSDSGRSDSGRSDSGRRKTSGRGRSSHRHRSSAR